MQKITNIKQLRESLLSNYDKLERRQLNIKEAKELTAMSGKIMSSCKLELSYAKHHNKKRKINFLES